MNKIFFKYGMMIFLTLLTVTGCEDNTVIIEEEEEYLTGELVPLSLSLTVDDITIGNDDLSRGMVSRSVADDDGISADIVNLLMVQFDGTDNDSQVIRTQYIGVTSDEDFESLKLLGTTNNSLVIFVANSFNTANVSTDDTLADVKIKGFDIDNILQTEESGIYYGDGLVESDTDGSKYFMLSDSHIFEGGVSEAKEITLTMKRNVSKVNLTVTNEWSGSEIVSISLENIPYTAQYYTNRSHEFDDYSAIRIPETINELTSYNHTTSLKNSAGATASETLNYYVPVNMRGTVSTATEKTKPLYAPTGATYARIGIIYPDAEDDEVTYYKFYLGANLTTDYNLEPNMEYTYNLTFQAAADPTTDFRVEVKAEVFTNYSILKSSNCYILNPSETAIREFIIPIAPRINEYWNGYGGSADKISDSDITTWEYEVLWYDTDSNISDIEFEKVLAGAGGTTPSLLITVPESYSNYGNILIAVKQDGDILWSWHLWITDYNPYYHGLTDTDMGSYLLPNGTGYIQRYSNTTTEWGSGGIYSDKYIMDRNIGARSASPTTTDGFLYYQFGRKDPFPLDGNAKKSDGTDFDYTTSASAVSMATAVANPTNYYKTGTSWCTDCNGTTYLWSDSKLTDLTSGEKSIFDPSPYRFRLPIYKVWSMFSSSTFYTDEAPYTTGRKFYYYYNSEKTDIYYPACGYISAGNGEMGTGGTIYWSLQGNTCATPYSSSHAYLLYSGYKDNGYTYNSSQVTFIRASGTSARCIEDVVE